jgi:hypothetical protein
MKRLLVAGVLGGVALFVWGFLSHVILPLGQTGLRTLPDEVLVVGPMQQSLQEPGIYVFPGMNPDLQSDPAVVEAWAEKHRAGPRGLIVYNPEGADPMSPTQLAIELLSNILAAVVAAYLISKTGAPMARVIWLSMLLGLFAWAVVHVSHWNWYGFPGDYTAAALLDEVVGWSLAGVAMGWILKPAPEAETA